MSDPRPLFRACSEDPDMSQKLQEFVRETLAEMVHSLPPEERLKGLSVEERLKGLPPEERVTGLSPEEVIRMIRALPPGTREAVARELEANDADSRPQ